MFAKDIIFKIFIHAFKLCRHIRWQEMNARRSIDDLIKPQTMLCFLYATSYPLEGVTSFAISFGNWLFRNPTLLSKELNNTIASSIV